MDFFQYCLILSVIIGIGFIVYSIVNFHGADEAAKDETDLSEAMLLNKKIDEFDSTIKDADNVINDLENLSKGVFKEFDEKYQELLFLYNLLDEKKQEVAKLEHLEKQPLNQPYALPVTAAQKPVNPKLQEDRRDLREGSINSKFKQIMALKSGGMNVSEIAKELDMGKGEVSLILELGSRQGLA